MQTVADLTVDQILLFLLAFVRVATLIAVFPILGSRGTPLTVKAGLSFFLTLILFPLLLPRVVDIPTGVFSFAVIAIKEVLVGLILGFAAGIFFSIVQYGAHIIDQQMGFTMAEIIDPLTDTSTTPIAQLAIVIFTISFLVLGGHRLFIQALAKSFEVIAIGNVHFRSGPISEVFISMTGQIFDLGLRFSAPVLVALFITTAALGIIARTAPQLNIFIVGLPLQIGIGFLALVVCLPSLFRFFEGLMLNLQKDLYSLIKLMA